MVIILSQVEADCFKKELNVHTQAELDTLLTSYIKDAAEFVSGTILPDGSIRFEGTEIFIMNLFTLMRDKIGYVVGVKTTSLGLIKTGISLFSDIKRDYKRAIEISKHVSARERTVSDDLSGVTVSRRPKFTGLFNNGNQNRQMTRSTTEL